MGPPDPRPARRLADLHPRGGRDLRPRRVHHHRLHRLAHGAARLRAGVRAAHLARRGLDRQSLLTGLCVVPADGRLRKA
ncbi:hypothetical protein G5V59_01925 [Nocardioides sp. W3-2-3]|uniref:hypothetical protein n=1 Tax=Nocardioides convexus TaxID=2712224 RepID=UPI002418895E|nr:hypothetical protein [Nocardioides convexus]NGZ99561.1 hypothetical protein [Nocardioides convexus]